MPHRELNFVLDILRCGDSIWPKAQRLYLVISYHTPNCGLFDGGGLKVIAPGRNFDSDSDCEATIGNHSVSAAAEGSQRRTDRADSPELSWLWPGGSLPISPDRTARVGFGGGIADIYIRSNRGLD
jgi:hypothetical protein